MPDDIAIPNAALVSLEQLSAEFADFVLSVESELEIEETTLEVSDETAAALRDAVESSLERRDRLAELVFAIDAQEGRLSEHVRRAEMAARHMKAMADRMRWSLQVYMLTKGLKKIPGEVNTFCLYKNPDRLIVTDESAVPEEFFEVSTVIHRRLNAGQLWKVCEAAGITTEGEMASDVKTIRTLNKQRLAEALEKGTEVSGAYLEKNRTRLQIR